jgi:hypothetical protein
MNNLTFGKDESTSENPTSRGLPTSGALNLTTPPNHRHVPIPAPTWNELLNTVKTLAEAPKGLEWAKNIVFIFLGASLGAGITELQQSTAVTDFLVVTIVVTMVLGGTSFVLGKRETLRKSASSIRDILLTILTVLYQASINPEHTEFLKPEAASSKEITLKAKLVELIDSLIERSKR